MSILRLCSHHALNGTDCKAPAMRGSGYCRHHRPYHSEAALIPAYIFEVTDADSLWAATKRLVYDNIEGTVNMDPKTIYQCAQELQKFARQNLTKPPRPRRGARRHPSE